ncbi:MAG TPA: diguanylate cyclase, partial [Acidimicrobiales bacterium]|nr:diguanylate cyclase [Acidimicrobiales bacterium]
MIAASVAVVSAVVAVAVEARLSPLFSIPALVCLVVAVSAVWSRAASSAHSRLEAREDYFRTVLDSVGDLVVALDSQGRATYVSPSCQQILGRSPDELVGGLGLHSVYAGDVQLAEAFIGRLLSGPGQRVSGELRVTAADGTVRLLSGSATSLPPGHNAAAVVIAFTDVTEERRLAGELAKRAVLDELTGLPNRALVKDRCAQMLARSDDSQHRAAVLFVDLDDFRNVNDSLGHLVGDALLVAVAERLASVVRPTDTLGRLGADEFVILTDDDESGEGSAHLADRVLELFGEPFEVAGASVPLPITASIGIANAARQSVGELMRDADVALYQAKTRGKRCCVLFEDAMFSALKQRLQLDMDLRAAVDAAQFFLVYQPTFNLVTREVTGVEALIRWNHPTRGTVSPA